MSRSTYF